MNINNFNNLSKEDATKQLFTCCGSDVWANEMMLHFPFIDEQTLVECATNIWYNKCAETEWRQAFTHHPKIGDVNSLKEKFAGKEQASITAATEETINQLAQANAEYENKFGFIFIVCATGKSAAEMLRLLQDRLRNSVDEELNIAMGEQQKITIIRFKKLFDEVDFSFLKVSQLTTHILDTTKGRPAKDISIKLFQKTKDSWKLLAQGVTNNDGRIVDLLPPQKAMDFGLYKLDFELETYFVNQKINPFYPQVEILFNITEAEHYHVPLLLNPFGYSTYRGS